MFNWPNKGAPYIFMAIDNLFDRVVAKKLCTRKSIKLWMPCRWQESPVLYVVIFCATNKYLRLSPHASPISYQRVVENEKSKVCRVPLNIYANLSASLIFRQVRFLRKSLIQLCLGIYRRNGRKFIRDRYYDAVNAWTWTSAIHSSANKITVSMPTATTFSTSLCADQGSKWLHVQPGIITLGNSTAGVKVTFVQKYKTMIVLLSLSRLWLSSPLFGAIAQDWKCAKGICEPYGSVRTRT